MNVFSIFDSKAEGYLQPFFSKTNATAIRLFEQACENPEHDFNKHAADYTLFHIGTFDEDTGLITAGPHMVNLGNAIQFQPMSRTEQIMGNDFPRTQPTNSNELAEFIQRTEKN